jgi:hypothetical protein
MTRRLAAVVLLGLTLTGCSSNNFRDVEGVDSHDADAYYLVNNLDGHPNLVRVCQDGVAFLTTTRDLDAVERIPEWDRFCPPAESKVLQPEVGR